MQRSNTKGKSSRGNGKQIMARENYFRVTKLSINSIETFRNRPIFKLYLNQIENFKLRTTLNFKLHEFKSTSMYTNVKV